MYTYKDQLNIHSQRYTQVISSTLHNIVSTSQTTNLNVLDVISTVAYGNTLPAQGEKRKRGKRQAEV